MEKQVILEAYLLILDRWLAETENPEAENILYRVARRIEAQMELN